VKNIPCYCIGQNNPLQLYRLSTLPLSIILDCSQTHYLDEKFYIKLVKQFALLSRFADECLFNVLTLLHAREYSPNTTFLVFRYNPFCTEVFKRYQSYCKCFSCGSTQTLFCFLEMYISFLQLILKIAAVTA